MPQKSKIRIEKVCYGWYNSEVLVQPTVLLSTPPATNTFSLFNKDAA